MSGRVVRLGLLGSGLSHSASRDYYAAYFRQRYGIEVEDVGSCSAFRGDGVSGGDIERVEYGIYDIAEADFDREVLGCLRSLDGCNITSPYKVRVISYLDYVSRSALLVGSVNVVKRVGGMLCGYNTDYMGFAGSFFGSLRSLYCVKPKSGAIKPSSSEPYCSEPYCSEPLSSRSFPIDSFSVEPKIGASDSLSIKPYCGEPYCGEPYSIKPYCSRSFPIDSFSVEPKIGASDSLSIKPYCSEPYCGESYSIKPYCSEPYCSRPFPSGSLSSEPYCGESYFSGGDIGYVRGVGVRGDFVGGVGVGLVGVGLRGVEVLILGCGGVSLAVRYVLGSYGLGYCCVSRNLEDRSGSRVLEDRSGSRVDVRCGSMGYGFSRGVYRYSDLDEQIIKKHKIIINCTPLGMMPNIDTYPNIPYEYLTKEHFLYDCIYNPSKTMFLHLGEEHGAKIKNGWEMFQIQANKSLKIWDL